MKIGISIPVEIEALSKLEAKERNTTQSRVLRERLIASYGIQDSEKPRNLHGCADDSHSVIPLGANL